MDGVGIDHHFHHQHQQQHLNHEPFTTQQLPPQPMRKRKAEAAPENNERLSKRMSLLNLEQSGQKLYVPVENPGSQQQPSQPLTHKKSHQHKHPPGDDDDSQMQLDDTKYKVYIYNLDDELSSSENESDDGRLVFLPDIEKHLRSSRRIPDHVLGAGRPDAPAAAGKELVLYRVPSSLTVPEEQDSVRAAVMEARERARERQRVERERRGGEALPPAPQGQVPRAAQQQQPPPPPAPPVSASPMMTNPSSSSLLTPAPGDGPVPMDADPLPGLEDGRDEDPDAMELD